MLHMCVCMHSYFVENHSIQILKDGPLISEVVLSQLLDVGHTHACMPSPSSALATTIRSTINYSYRTPEHHRPHVCTASPINIVTVAWPDARTISPTGLDRHPYVCMRSSVCSK
jgi:hypothetical protein